MYLQYCKLEEVQICGHSGVEAFMHQGFYVSHLWYVPSILCVVMYVMYLVTSNTHSSLLLTWAELDGFERMDSWFMMQ